MPVRQTSEQPIVFPCETKLFVFTLNPSHLSNCCYVDVCNDPSLRSHPNRCLSFDRLGVLDVTAIQQDSHLSAPFTDHMQPYNIAHSNNFPWSSGKKRMDSDRDLFNLHPVDDISTPKVRCNRNIYNELVPESGSFSERATRNGELRTSPFTVTDALRMICHKNEVCRINILS